MFFYGNICGKFYANSNTRISRSNKLLLGQDNKLNKWWSTVVGSGKNIGLLENNKGVSQGEKNSNGING